MGASIPTRTELGEAAPRRPPRPPWLRNRLRTGPNYLDLKGLVRAAIVNARALGIKNGVPEIEPQSIVKAIYAKRRRPGRRELSP